MIWVSFRIVFGLIGSSFVLIVGTPTMHSLNGTWKNHLATYGLVTVICMFAGAVVGITLFERFVAPWLGL